MSFSFTSRQAEFLRFSVVGVVGFLANAGSVALFSRLSGLYVAGLLAWVVAATVTWFLNRNWTFAGRGHGRLLAQWCRYMAANSVGLLVYYAFYAGAIAMLSWCALHPVGAVAIGSLAGLAVNFTLARRAVF